MAAITVEGLTKRFGEELAVDRLDFQVEQGTVTGFLGPNGAGKTTTLRMLLGLVAPTSGTAAIAGRPYRELADPLRQVGAVLEAGGFHPGRSARDHLRVLATAAGLAQGRVDQVLEQVGLAAAGGRRVGGFSLGMRQRLGLAGALLGEPEVLILDEPANGLDPEGIYWMRGLLRDFADRAGTVLLSSHLLTEVEAVADQLIVIGNGRIVAQGAKHELLATSGVIVRSLDPAELHEALADAGLTATPGADGALLVEAPAETVGRLAAERGIVLLELRPADTGGLERLFLSLTREEALVA